MLTSFGRAMSLTQRAARRLPTDARGRRARRHRRRPTSTRWPTGSADTSTACCTRSGSRPSRASGGGFLTAPWEDVAVAMQVSRVLVEGAGGRVPAADGDRRQHRRPRLRQQPRRLARLRLDGRGQGRVRVDRALPRPRPRPRRHPRQPRRGRTDPHDRGAQHPRLRAVRGRVGRAGRRSAGTSRTPRRSQPRASRCSPTCSPRPPARSSTSTAATTPSAPEEAPPELVSSLGFRRSDTELWNSRQGRRARADVSRPGSERLRRRHSR